MVYFARGNNKFIPLFVSNSFKGVDTPSVRDIWSCRVFRQFLFYTVQIQLGYCNSWPINLHVLLLTLFCCVLFVINTYTSFITEYRHYSCMYCYVILVSCFSLSSCGDGGEFLSDTKSWASRVFLAASTTLAMAGSWVFPSQIQGPVLSYFVFCRNIERTDIGKRQILLFFVRYKLVWWIESFPSWQTVFPQQLVFDLDLHTGWGSGLTSYLIHRTKRFWFRIVLKTSSVVVDPFPPRHNLFGTIISFTSVVFR